MENKKEIEKNDSHIVNEEIRKDFTPEGKFAPGNQVARLKGKTYNKEAFLEALQTVGNEHIDPITKKQGEDYLLHILRVNWGNKAFHKVIIDKFVEDAPISYLGKAIQEGNTIILQFTPNKLNEEKTITLEKEEDNINLTLQDENNRIN